MRPIALTPLFAEATTLPGVGPKVAGLLDRLLGEPGRPARVIDLLFHLPHSVVDRSARPKLRDAVPGSIVTLELTVEEHRPPPPGRSRAPYRIVCGDETGDMTLVFFNGVRARLEKLLPIGQKRWISGMLETFDGRFQMVHPDRIVDEAGPGGPRRLRAGLWPHGGAVSARARPGRGGARSRSRPTCRSGRTRPG